MRRWWAWFGPIRRSCRRWSTTWLLPALFQVAICTRCHFVDFSFGVICLGAGGTLGGSPLPLASPFLRVSSLLPIKHQLLGILAGYENAQKSQEKTLLKDWEPESKRDLRLWGMPKARPRRFALRWQTVPAPKAGASSRTPYFRTPLHPRCPRLCALAFRRRRLHAVRT